ncbi:DNA/RNA helicase, superfamily I [Rheinheimera sp. A13L]|nr:DNA/RNA helicase, superfamily I [Rheinheimera sp. A13L]
MSNGFFFLQADQNNYNGKFIRRLDDFSNENKTQIFVINKPLGESRYNYSYTGAIILLVPKHKIMIINFEDSDDDFEDYYLDLLEDIASISDKYHYKSVLGRLRNWKDDLVSTYKFKKAAEIESVKSLLNENKIENLLIQKKSELVISLLTGSINDIERVKDDVPESILDKIKQKIILFDGDQTRFIYHELDKKVVKIQGLSGTGKTELLLHKLRDIYVNKESSKVLLTCHNKILAASLRKRIPEFFNFMKVEQQIEWDERLWCVHAWGASSDECSGAYRYICHIFDIKFQRYSYTMSFARACRLAIDHIKKLSSEDHKFAFDYVLIDESQDFPEEFIELCSIVTKDKVYVAGDIFQGIFDENIISQITPDYLLNKCYRTDPRTLMFAHALGMGLFEKNKLRWLNDDQWGTCGYLVDKEMSSKIYNLRREPLRRFEDLETDNISSIDIAKTDFDQDKQSDLVISVIQKIKNENPTLSANDIGIVFTGPNSRGFDLANILEYKISRQLNWRLNKAWESKNTVKDSVFISNKNNVKGLEFPFVICVSELISDMKHERNALYMLLTRSFIKSYLIISNQISKDKIESIENGLSFLKKNGYLKIEAPNEKDLEKIRTSIDVDESKMSIFDMTDAVFEELEIPGLWREPLLNLVKNMDPENVSYEVVREFVLSTADKMAIRK